MSIRDDLFAQYQVYRKQNKETPNSKPNRIILNRKAYDEMLATSKMKDKPNPIMSFDDVVMNYDPEQVEAIKFEKRRFYK